MRRHRLHVQQAGAGRGAITPVGMAALALGLALRAGPAPAGITYDASNDCLQVVDYPPSEPATLEALLEADKQAGWGRVTHEPGTDTYTVNAALWVGDGSGYSTCLRIGDTVHTGVTLVLKGSLWVRPAARGIERADGSPSIMNSVVAGDPANPAVRPRILFDCEWAGEHGIFAGQPGRTVRDACTLRMYNVSVGALAPGDPRRRWGGMHYRRGGPRGAAVTTGCYLHELRLEQCRFSDFVGPLFYGAETLQTGRRGQGFLPHPRSSIRGCLFEDGGVALFHRHRVVGCGFRNLDQTVRDLSLLWAYDCAFEGNGYNWLLDGNSARGVTLVDCRVAPQREPFTMLKNTKPRPDQGIPEYPTAHLMATLRVRVTDAAGRPAPMASVSVAGAGVFERPDALTGPDGWTGGDPLTDGVVVAVKRYTATDDPGRPACAEDFRYEVSAAAGGKTAAATVRSADLDAPVVLVLK